MAAKNRVRGGSLVEAVLALSLVTAVGALTFGPALKAKRATDARNVGEYMAAFQAAAVSYGMDNNAAILGAAADGTGASTTCVGNYVNSTTFDTLNNTTKKTCAVDASWLVFKGYLPASFKVTNPLGQAPVAIFRRVYSGATPTSNLEMFLASASAVGTKTYTNVRSMPDMQEAFSAANGLGTNMGVVPADTNMPGCVWDPATATNRFACGTQGAWKVNISDFVN